MLGRVQLGSGSKSFHKGDVLSDKFLVECKTTDKASMSVKLEWLVKILEEATDKGRIAALQIDIGGRSYWLFNDADIEVNVDGSINIGDKS